MPYMETGQSRLHWTWALCWGKWSALLNAVCLYSVSESKLTKASLLSSSLPRLAFALLPSLVQPFLTYCSIKYQWTLCGQYFVLRANLYSWPTIINTYWTGRFVLVINLLQNPLLLRLHFLCRDKMRSFFSSISSAEYGTSIWRKNLTVLEISIVWYRLYILLCLYSLFSKDRHKEKENSIERVRSIYSQSTNTYILSRIFAPIPSPINQIIASKSGEKHQPKPLCNLPQNVRWQQHNQTKLLLIIAQK